jgi:N-formylglutamate amidohydrolase
MTQVNDSRGVQAGDNGVQVNLFAGLRDVGKTQLAAAYARACIDDGRLGIDRPIPGRCATTSQRRASRQARGLT